jgi:small nuclear ribonucleoprotein (snRNP)-like protein
LQVRLCPGTSLGMSSDAEAWMRSLVGQVVVVDLDESYLVIGTLTAVDQHHLSFKEADLHDHGEANCTKDVYLLETRQLGVRFNRKEVAIPRSRVLAISRLEDIAP